MNSSKLPATRPRIVRAGLVYVCSFNVFIGFVAILEPRARGRYALGWQIVSFGFFAIAMSLVLVGISLLTWIVVQECFSRPKCKPGCRPGRRGRMWDIELDG